MQNISGWSCLSSAFTVRFFHVLFLWLCDPPNKYCPHECCTSYPFIVLFLPPTYSKCILLIGWSFLAIEWFCFKNCIRLTSIVQTKPVNSKRVGYNWILEVSAVGVCFWRVLGLFWDLSALVTSASAVTFVWTKDSNKCLYTQRVRNCYGSVFFKECIIWRCLLMLVSYKVIY